MTSAWPVNCKYAKLEGGIIHIVVLNIPIIHAVMAALLSQKKNDLVNL